MTVISHPDDDIRGRCTFEIPCSPLEFALGCEPKDARRFQLGRSEYHGAVLVFTLGNRVMSMVSYCPFCGEAYPIEATESDGAA